MALIECPECGRSISSEADVCPHCGRKSDAFKRAEAEDGCTPAMMSLGIALTLFITIPMLLLLFWL